MRHKKQNGFTLIELLVVIAIIGLLSSVVLASLNSARAKGRDARRLADLQQMANQIVALGENTTFATCTGADAIASTCTTPNLAGYNDPSGAAAACVAASAANCNYAVSQDGGAAGATASNFQICARLEQPAGTLAAGVVSLGTGSGYSIVNGGCD